MQEILAGKGSFARPRHSLSLGIMPVVLSDDAVAGELYLMNDMRTYTLVMLYFLTF